MSFSFLYLEPSLVPLIRVAYKSTAVAYLILQEYSTSNNTTEDYIFSYT